MPGGGDQSNETGGPALLAFGRSPYQRAVDEFRGVGIDKLGDDAYADPRETRVIGIVNNLRRADRILGIGVVDALDPPDQGVRMRSAGGDRGGPGGTGEGVVMGITDP